jgi:hypothetical protein
MIGWPASVTAPTPDHASLTVPVIVSIEVETTASLAGDVIVIAGLLESMENGALVTDTVFPALSLAVPLTV